MVHFYNMDESNFKYFFLNSINFLYFVCGLFLVAGSLAVLTDSEKILISRLITSNTNEPILYYICLAVLILGLFVSVLSTVGCWAIYADNNCFLTTYVFGVVVLLFGKCVIGIIIATCPEYFGLYFDKDSLTQVWQRNYGVPGKEQYTVAIDLIQFECCGVISGSDYSTSWWHLEKLSAPNLTVPISCCYLDRQLTKSFLDLVPISLSACQDISVEKYHTARYIEGCFAALDRWLNNQKMTLLLAAIMNLTAQLLILFGVVSTCVKSKQHPLQNDVNKSITYMSHD